MSLQFDQGLAALFGLLLVLLVVYVIILIWREPNGVPSLITAASLLLLGWIVWQFYFIIIYFLIAGVLGLIGRPLVHLFMRARIGKFKMPRSLAALLTILSFLGIFALFVSLVIPLIANQARILSTINTNEVITSLQGPLHDLEVWLEQFNPQQDEPIDLIGYSRLVITEVTANLSFQSILNSTVGFLGNVFIGAFAILFATFFFLREQQLFSKIIMTLTPDKYEEQGKRILVSSKELLTRYFIGIILQLTAFSIIVALGLLVLDVKYALIIAFIAGLVNIIPYLGPIIGAGFGIFVGITTNLEMDFYGEMMPLLIKIMVVFWIAQLLDNYLFQPAIFSNVVKAHPLEIFAVVLFAGFFSGIFGMVIAIPAYTFIRIIAKEFLSEFKLVKNLTKHI